jgi:hypothetical protein
VCLLGRNFGTPLVVIPEADAAGATTHLTIFDVVLLGAAARVEAYREYFATVWALYFHHGVEHLVHEFIVTFGLRLVCFPGCIRLVDTVTR